MGVGSAKAIAKILRRIWCPVSLKITVLFSLPRGQGYERGYSAYWEDYEFLKCFVLFDTYFFYLFKNFLVISAGAMIYVVFDSIIPEAYSRGNGKTSSLFAIFGFLVMMSMDVGL